MTLTDTRQAGIQAEKYDAGVGKHTPDDDKVVELRAGHFYVSLVAVVDVDAEENCRHDYAEDGTRR